MARHDRRNSPPVEVPPSDAPAPEAEAPAPEVPAELPSDFPAPVITPDPLEVLTPPPPPVPTEDNSIAAQIRVREERLAEIGDARGDAATARKAWQDLEDEKRRVLFELNGKIEAARTSYQRQHADKWSPLICEQGRLEDEIRKLQDLA